MMIEFLMSFIGWGAEWILYVLFAASLAGIALFVERFLFFRKNNMNLSKIFGALGMDEKEKHKSPEEAKKALESIDGHETVAGRLALLTLSCFGRSPEASDELLSVAKNKERRNLERGVGFFATLGSNAPFLGLLGTVLGLTNAFHALSVAKTAGPQVVYEGISEALVTTVVGLLVAIPAVVSYNYLVQKVDSLISTGESVAREILARHIDAFFCNPNGGVPSLKSSTQMSENSIHGNEATSEEGQNYKDEQDLDSTHDITPKSSAVKSIQPTPRQSRSFNQEKPASADRSLANAR